jgi:hypothetical protein
MLIFTVRSLLELSRMQSLREASLVTRALVCSIRHAVGRQVRLAEQVDRIASILER